VGGVRVDFFDSNDVALGSIYFEGVLDPKLIDATDFLVG
jgi:hypothetical protein